MYPQREQISDRPQRRADRAARSYSKSATMILDLFNFPSGTNRWYPRPEKWHNGRVKVTVWDAADGYIQVYLLPVGSAEVSVMNEAHVFTGVSLQKFEYTSEAQTFRIDAAVEVIRVLGDFTSARLEYVPDGRQ